MYLETLSLSLSHDFNRMVQVVEPSQLNVKSHVPRDVVYKGIRDCFSKIYKDAGVRGLYRGVGMYVAVVPYGSIEDSCASCSDTYVSVCQLHHSTESFLMLD